jgi:hypothetical protein
VTEELLSEIEEEELDDRRFEACEEIDRYAKERWDCENLFGGGCCRWYLSEKDVVEVELCGGRVIVDEVDIENIRRILEKHGLAVKRVEIDVWAGDFTAEVALRFHVALAAVEETWLHAGIRWLFS